jgi:signal transduction histidine kinase
MISATGGQGRAYRLRYPATPGEALRAERLLAKGRVTLSAWAALAVALDPAQQALPHWTALGLLVGYVLFALFFVLLLRKRTELPAVVPLLAQAADVLWAIGATALTGGLASPFFIMFVLPLLGAAYRWGAAETMVTAGAGVALLAAQLLLPTPPGWVPAGVPVLSLRNLLIRAGSLIVMAHLLGRLADDQHRREAEAAIVERVVSRLQQEAGLNATLEALLGDVVQLFGAGRALLALTDADSGRAYLWDAMREGEAGEVQFRRQELAAAGRARYLFDARGDAWRARRIPGDGPAVFSVLAVDERGARVAPGAIPGDTAAELAGACVVAASVGLGNQWVGRLLLIDPAPLPREPELRLLQALLRRAAPAVYGAHLMSRLQVRAGAAERARVARELHDGVIQSLIGLEMQVDVLRQQALAKASDKAGALTHVQALLRHEIIVVRELMDQMRAVEVGPTELVERLAGMVDRFGRETGITARFVSEVEEVSLSPRLCGEVTRIVQEALINVRRHSGASHVVVRFSRENGAWALLIDDDGAGFGFSGRLDLAGLDSARQGPLVIKERVRAAGGQLSIDSNPGQGSRLEILISERHG